MKREEAHRAILPLFTDELFVTTSGGATSEWYDLHPRDGNIQFKTLGLCSSAGLGLALALPHRRVVVFDGDGALWMNLGSLATIGLQQPRNLVHVCWDNREYESSGGEPSVSAGGRIDFAGVARSAGVSSSCCAETIDQIVEAMRRALSTPGPHFIWARIEPGRTLAAPYPFDELENKYRFIRHVEQTEGISILRQPLPHSYGGHAGA